MNFDRRCLVCHALENPSARGELVNTGLAYLCPYCKDKLRYLVGIKDTCVTETANIEHSEKKIYLYGARDTETGKLVSDITNPKRKYWDREGNARSAIDYYNRCYAGKDIPKYKSNKGSHGIVELVKFELIEVPVEEIED